MRGGRLKHECGREIDEREECKRSRRKHGNCEMFEKSSEKGKRKKLNKVRASE